MESTGCPPIEQTRKIWDETGEQGYKRVVVTARSAQYYKPTLWWLLLNGFEPDDMYMRGWKDQRSDDIVKEDILKIIQSRYNPVLAVDDNPSVLAVWRKHGIPTIEIPGWID